MVGSSGGKIVAMGKSGNAIKAVAGVIIVATPIDAPFEDCYNVNATACPSLAPEQHHVHGGESKASAPEPEIVAAGSDRPIRDLSGATISVIEA
jgi:hypothetical protein